MGLHGNEPGDLVEPPLSGQRDRVRVAEDPDAVVDAGGRVGLVARLYVEQVAGDVAGESRRVVAIIRPKSIS